jgi:L-fuconolactonase
MVTIDAQVHAYERKHPGRPWAAALHGPPEVTGDDMVVAMDSVGVDAAILVSPFTMYRYDASYALEVHAAHPARFALIKPVAPTDAAVADTIADWAATEGAVAVRIMMTRGVSIDAADPGIDRVLAPPLDTRSQSTSCVGGASNRSDNWQSGTRRPYW